MSIKREERHNRGKRDRGGGGAGERSRERDREREMKTGSHDAGPYSGVDD